MRVLQGLGAACEGPDISRGVSEREKRQILDTHNRQDRESVVEDSYQW